MTAQLISLRQAREDRDLEDLRASMSRASATLVLLQLHELILQDLIDNPPKRKTKGEA